MKRRQFSIAISCSTLFGCASTEQKNFQNSAFQYRSITVQSPEWEVQIPQQVMNDKLFSKEVQSDYSDQEMLDWNRYFERYYSSSEVRNRFNLLLKESLLKRGLSDVSFLSNTQPPNTDSIILEFKNMSFSGIAFGRGRGKRMILTVSGRRKMTAGDEKLGDLYYTHKSPRSIDESKGIVRPSDMIGGKDFAIKSLDEALVRWINWALFALRKP